MSCIDHILAAIFFALDGNMLKLAFSKFIDSRTLRIEWGYCSPKMMVQNFHTTWRHIMN